MGRVARYKKIKACDPFAKQSVRANSGVIHLINPDVRKKKKRSAKYQKRKKKAVADKDHFDLPPEEDDFNMNDPNLSVKDKSQIKTKEEWSGTGYHIPETSKEEAKIARLLKMDERSLHQKEEKKPAPKIQARWKGESMRAFAGRVDHEAHKIIQNELSAPAPPEPDVPSARKERRKEHVINKKKKKKEKKVARAEQHDVIDDEIAEITETSKITKTSKITETAEYSPAIPSFMQQATRPPTFHVLPRHAKSKNTGTKSAGKLLDARRQEAERQNMEMLRDRAQAQYALIKARRRKAGEFHL